MDQEPRISREGLEVAKPSEPHPGCLLSDKVGQNLYTLTALEPSEMQTVHSDLPKVSGFAGILLFEKLVFLDNFF